MLAHTTQVTLGVRRAQQRPYSKQSSLTRLAPHLRTAQRDDNTLAATPEGAEDDAGETDAFDAGS